MGRIFKSSDCLHAEGKPGWISHSQYTALLGSHEEFIKMMDTQIHTYSNLGNRLVFVSDGDTEMKKEIISSMYPEKITFEGFSVRTNRINEVARLIYSMDVGSSENKNRTNQNISSLSCQVVLPVQFSNLFLMDLQRLANIVA